jgi:Sec7-like guanine-nucleotide exchange factor
MEMNEPMCFTNVPREGIVVRISDDPVAEAFKLKCIKFLEKEAKNIDKGEVDMEMIEKGA